MDSNKKEKADIAHIIQRLKSTNHADLAELFEGFMNIADDALKEFNELTTIYYQVLEEIPQAIWIWKGNKWHSHNQKAKEISSIVSNRTVKSILDLNNMEIKIDEKYFLFYAKFVSDDMMVVLATDITEQKIQERYASMGKISAHLAHEIRTPLASITLLNATLSKSEDEKIKKISLLLNDATKRLENIVDSTLNFYKSTKINKKIINLQSIQKSLENGFASFNNHALAKLEFSGFDGEIYADGTLLEMVFNNFISNSLDSIEELDDRSKADDFEGKISLKATREANGWGFYIRDNGEKIAKASELFTPWSTTKLKGTGIGLAYCSQIVSAHGGEISLLDEENKIFYILIKQDS